MKLGNRNEFWEGFFGRGIVGIEFCNFDDLELEEDMEIFIFSRRNSTVKT